MIGAVLDDEAADGLGAETVPSDGLAGGDAEGGSGAAAASGRRALRLGVFLVDLVGGEAARPAGDDASPAVDVGGSPLVPACASSASVSSTFRVAAARITASRGRRSGVVRAWAAPTSPMRESHERPRRRPCSPRKATSSSAVFAPGGTTRQPSGGKRRITVPSRDVADGWVSIRRRLLGCIPAARARAASVMPRAAARARIACRSPTASTPSAYLDAARDRAQHPAGPRIRGRILARRCGRVGASPPCDASWCAQRRRIMSNEAHHRHDAGCARRRPPARAA